MELSADARKRIREFYKKVEGFVLGVEKLAKECGENSPDVQGYAIAGINELLAIIRSAGIMLKNLSVALRARAEAAGVAKPEIARIELRANEARERIERSMDSFRVILEQMKYSFQKKTFPHPLIDTLRIYTVLPPELLRSRIDMLIAELEDAEAILYEATKAV
ncbi:MAG: hypothetical protein QXR48_04850 [Candidatus Woesearchaeota archaeon]